jgi:hypothetical protein
MGMKVLSLFIQNGVVLRPVPDALRTSLTRLTARTNGSL